MSFVVLHRIHPGPRQDRTKAGFLLPKLRAYRQLPKVMQNFKYTWLEGHFGTGGVKMWFLVVGFWLLVIGLVIVKMPTWMTTRKRNVLSLSQAVQRDTNQPTT
jgi:hypothetical protein